MKLQVTIYFQTHRPRCLISLTTNLQSAQLRIQVRCFANCASKADLQVRIKNRQDFSFNLFSETHKKTSETVCEKSCQNVKSQGYNKTQNNEQKRLKLKILG